MSSALLGMTVGRGDGFRLRGCYPLWRPFPRPSTIRALCDSLEEVQLPLTGPTTPEQQRPHAVTLPRFRLSPVRSPLLRGSRLLSLPPGTEMFQFPGFPLPALCVQTGVTRHDPCRVSPFGHPRINAWLAAPRGLSQPPTSFVGFWRLGIHRVPFVTWQLQRCSRSLCSSQGSRLGPCTRLAGRAGRFGIQAEPRGEVLATRMGTLPQSSTVCAAGSFPVPPFHTPYGAVLGGPAAARPNSQRSTPGATRP